MAAIFWSHANSYVGDYSIVRRTPHKEFTEGYHYHDFYEAQFYFNNDPETKDEPLGTIMLGDEMYKPKNGDVFLINMFDSHYIQMDNKKHYDRYCVSISPTLMLFICSEHSNLFNIYNKSNRNYPLMHMTEHQQQLFLQMYHDFEVRLKDMEHGKRFLEQSLLFGIIAQLYDIYYTETQIAPTDSLHMSTLTTLVRYIDEHIAEDLSLKQLSEVTNFSTYHLCRIFKKNTGTTLNKYIVSKRIENAKLLLAGDASIQTISKEVGFNNYNHFYRCFRQIVGINPADYREILLPQGDEALIQLQATGVIKRPADTDVLNEEDEDFGDENLDDEP